MPFNGTPNKFGRPKGSRNKRDMLLDEWFDKVVGKVINEEVLHPIDFLISVYTGEFLDPLTLTPPPLKLRMEAARDVAKYFCRQRSTDVNLTVDQVDEKVNDLSDDALDKIMHIAMEQRDAA